MLRLYVELARVRSCCEHLGLTRAEFEQLPAEIAEGLLVTHQAREEAIADRFKEDARGLNSHGSAG